MRLSTHHCVHKYPLAINNEGDGVFRADVTMPCHAEIRYVDMQGSDITLWAELDKEITGTEIRKFLVVGTGREFDACTWDTYVGTVREGPYVWHIFEDK